MEIHLPAQTVPPLGQPEPIPPIATRAQIQRHRAPGMNLIAVKSAPVSELHLTLTPVAAESPAAMVRRLARAMAAWDATIVRQIAFGSTNTQPAILAAFKQAFAAPAPPLIWVEGASCGNHPIAGMQVHAVTGAKVRAWEGNDGAAVRVWDDARATHCVVSVGGPIRTRASPRAQTTRTFENLQAALAQAGMTMKDMARTWFFLDDILSWYGDFNHARNDFFARNELRAGGVPASTGVSGRNPAGAALTAAAWAVKSHAAKSRAVQVVASPLQCAAPSYGSAFSRAVEINSAGFRQLLVSGTASIAPEGQTAHVGDVRAQIELSMQVVQAILEGRQMSLADVTRATVYFKSPAAAPLWEAWCARHEQTTLPVVRTGCDICRSDLLFEIELDAIRTVA